MSSSKLRFNFFSLAIIAVGLLLVARLFDLQILHSEEYNRRSLHQQTSSAQNLYDRGTIYFKERNGTLLSAATLESGYVLVLHPDKFINSLLDAEATYTALEAIIPLDKIDFMAKSGRTNDPYEELAHRLSSEVANKIIALKLPTITLEEERWRYYPGDTLASHALGFVGFVDKSVEGRAGVELSYEKILERKEQNIYSNFFAKLFAQISDTIFSNTQEGDVVLTIEPQVQSYVEKVLRETRQTWNATNAGVIVLDPSTGEITAMAGAPNFNPNTYNKETDSSVFPNPLVESAYEMGSTFKPITISSALDAKVITPKTTYIDKGYVELNGAKLQNYDKKGRGLVDMQEVLNQSLNTGTIFAMEKLGRDKFRNYLFAFGLTDRTGVDLPNETAGLTDNLQSNRDVEYATASFGQGIATSPLAMARALGALGNGGTLIKPHIVAAVRPTFGPMHQVPVIEQGRAISADTSEEITRMLVRVVDEALLHGTVKMEHYSIAAKTGTAQIAKQSSDGYYDDRYLHTFFGYFPAYQPKFLVLLYLHSPQGAQFASQTLTAPFMDITKYLINYYEIPPDR